MEKEQKEKKEPGLVKSVHRSRYERHTLLGMTTEQIARQDKVSKRTVELSISSVATYRQVCTLSQVEATQMDIMLDLAEDRRAALRDMLTAIGPDGKPDYKTRTDGQRIYNELIEALKPKGKGTTVQVAVATGGQGDGVQPGVTVTSDFEGILRTIKQRKEAAGQLMAPEPEPEGTVIDAADQTQG